jgi:hypothetical protein
MKIPLATILFLARRSLFSDGILCFAALISSAARQWLRTTSDGVGRVRAHPKSRVEAHRRCYRRLVRIEFFGYGGRAYPGKWASLQICPVRRYRFRSAYPLRIMALVERSRACPIALLK